MVSEIPKLLKAIRHQYASLTGGYVIGARKPLGKMAPIANHLIGRECQSVFCVVCVITAIN